MNTVAAPHALGRRELARSLEADPERGLEWAEAEQRLERYGPNRPRRVRRPPYFRLAVDQFLDPLVALLIGATAVSFAIGDTIEAAAIAAVLVVNAVLGFWQEAVAERAILALSQAFTQSAVVLRDGSVSEIPAEEVVPGDVLLVTEGERVAADARVLVAKGLEIDESALTGESLPVTKHVEPVAPSTALAERGSMIYAGTGVARGRGRALVSATGDATELGAIEALAATAKPPPTPLDRRLARLTRQMVVLGIALTGALGGALLLQGEPAHTAFLVGVAVAVAAVPEGLAATVTASLALGARALAARGAIVRRLDAVETLGEMTVVCTDKTGTLTENRIRVSAVRPAQGVDEVQVLEAGVLASAARATGDGRVLGDPVEAALLLAAMERGLSQEELFAGRNVVHEVPFDSERKLMTIVYEVSGSLVAFTKGAPEVVFARAEAPDPELVDLAEAWATEGFRVLAAARRSLDSDSELDDSVEAELELLGLIALHDPLRPTAAASIREARQAGIAVRMLTGDHPATARTVGHALGLAESEIYARATPTSKLELVAELQARGEVVAVTGDGVNDAPALRRADVGVAMGASGTEAAREAAAIVLTDDDFATIVAAIHEGRLIGDNIRKFVAFLLSANLGEVLVFAVAILAGLGAPLAVIQVLLVNLVTDGPPALALTQDPASPELMGSGPRRSPRLFERRLLVLLGLVGVFVGASTLAAFGAGKAFGGDSAQTMAYATLALSELALVFAIRSPSTAAWRLPFNSWLGAAAAGAALFVALSVYLPFAQTAFETVALGPAQALVVIALSIVPFALVELLKGVRRSRLEGPGQAPRTDRNREAAPRALRAPTPTE
jgi:Ca2+-transporting ATPase